MYLTNTAADLAAIVRGVDHPRVQTMYDTSTATSNAAAGSRAVSSCR